MAIPSFNSGYPYDGSSLGQTKASIRDNLDGTFLTLGVDHVNNNGIPGPPGTPPGYHTVIHQVTQGTVPAVMPGVNQIFSMIPTGPNAIPNNGDTQLFNLTGMGGLSQMTGDSSAQNGFVWCAGVLLQWGNGLTTNSTIQPVTFTVAFPNNCFFVTCVPIPPVLNSNSNSAVSSKGTSGFVFTHTTVGFPVNTPFNWFAIGF